MLLVSSSSIGDHEPPTFEQDARGALELAFASIRREHGPHVAGLASDVLGVLIDHDGMRWADVAQAVEESRSIRLLETKLLDRGIQVLLDRNVIRSTGGDGWPSDWRLWLNPAVAALVGRDA